MGLNTWGNAVVNTHAGGGKLSTGTVQKDTAAGAVGQVGSWYKRKRVAKISATAAVILVRAKSINTGSKPLLSLEPNPTRTARRLKKNRNNIVGSWVNGTNIYFSTIPLLNRSAISKGELQSDTRKTCFTIVVGLLEATYSPRIQLQLSGSRSG